MASASANKNKKPRKTCTTEVIHTDRSFTVNVVLNVDEELHVLFRIVEDFYFPDGPLPQFELVIKGTDKVLVGDETPRSCWGATSGGQYEVQMNILPDVDFEPDGIYPDALLWSGSDK